MAGKLALLQPTDCSPAGCSIHGILQASVLEWAAISFFRGSSRPRDQTCVSCIAGGFFTDWATREAPIKGKPVSVSGFVGPGGVHPSFSTLSLQQRSPRWSVNKQTGLRSNQFYIWYLNFIWFAHVRKHWSFDLNHLNSVVEPLCREGTEMQMLRTDLWTQRGRVCEMESWWEVAGHSGSPVWCLWWPTVGGERKWAQGGRETCIITTGSHCVWQKPTQHCQRF